MEQIINRMNAQFDFAKRAVSAHAAICLLDINGVKASEDDSRDNDTQLKLESLLGGLAADAVYEDFWTFGIPHNIEAHAELTMMYGVYVRCETYWKANGEAK